jgi:hypothetical protein
MTPGAGSTTAEIFSGSGFAAEIVVFGGATELSAQPNATKRVAATPARQ